MALPGWQGMGVMPMETSVFESGKMSDMFEHLPIDLSSKISRLYSLKAEYTRFTRSVSDRMLNMNAETKTIEMVIMMDILGNDVALFERQISEFCGLMLEELENPSNI